LDAIESLTVSNTGKDTDAISVTSSALNLTKFAVNTGHLVVLEELLQAFGVVHSLIKMHGESIIDRVHFHLATSSIDYLKNLGFLIEKESLYIFDIFCCLESRQTRKLPTVGYRRRISISPGPSLG